MNSRVWRRLSPLLLATAALLAGCGQASTESLIASAKDYLANGDRKAAVIQLKNVLQQDPDLGEARFLLGMILLDNGEATAASVELRKARALEHPPVAVLPALARSMLLEGQHKKLTEEFAATTLTDPAAAADLQTSLGTAYVALGQFDRADQAFAAALKALPDYAPARIAEAKLMVTRKDLPGALQRIDAVIAKSPQAHDAWQIRGDLMMAGDTKRPDEALEAYRKAIALKKDAVLAHAGAVSTLMRREDFDAAQTQLEAMKVALPRHPRTKYLEALLAYHREDFKTAKERIDETLRLAPDSLDPLQLAGIIEFRNKSLLQAEKHLSKALSIAPGLPAARMMLAETYVRTARPREAIDVLKPLLGTPPVDANVLALAAQAHLQTGDPQQAEALFAQAAQVDPQHTRSRTALAYGKLARGDVAAGLAELQKVAASDPTGYADLALINAQIRRNNPDAALKAIDAYERKHTDKPLAANLRGTVHLARQDEAAARKAFEQALSIDPVYYPAVARLAALDLLAQKPEAAKQRFERVLAVDPKHVQALIALAALESRGGAAPAVVTEKLATAIKLNPAEAAPRLLLIDHHLKNKDTRAAMTLGQDSVATLPDNADLLDALGRAQLAAGETNQASATFNKLVSLEPKSPRPHVRLADLHSKAQDTSAAIQSLKRALAVSPNLLPVQRNLLMLHLQATQQTEARALVREIQKQRPKEPVGYSLEGDLEASVQNWAGAASAYRKAMTFPGADELAPKLHGALLRAPGKSAEADAFAVGWSSKHPKDLGFQFYLGDLAIGRSDFSSAETIYMGVLRTTPDHAPTLNNLAWVTAKLGKSGALAYAEKANQLRPGEPSFMDTMAMILADAGQTAKALELQKQAIGKQPDNPALSLNLAKIYIKAGDKALAKAELDKLSKLSQKFVGQAEVGELLKTL